jgi:hypothetical protein
MDSSEEKRPDFGILQMEVEDLERGEKSEQIENNEGSAYQMQNLSEGYNMFHFQGTFRILQGKRLAFNQIKQNEKECQQIRDLVPGNPNIPTNKNKNGHVNLNF